MKKVLIWDKNLPSRNVGGPSGYMWNIKTYIEDGHASYHDNIVFYSDVIKEKQSFISFVDKVITSVLSKIGCKTASVLYRVFFPHGKLSIKEKTIISQYDFVHFHTLPSMLTFGDKVKALGVKSIYTSHTPELMIDECINQSKKAKFFFEKHLRVKDIFVKKEIKAYKIASYIMFPVDGVIECYSSKNEAMREFFSKADNIFYNPTAIKDCPHSPIKEILKSYNLPENAIKICYVGRHNEVKGYEHLKRIADIILPKRTDIFFVIGGQQGSSMPLSHSNWIELGWVNTHELLSEIDAFILPNQQTYFDIIALEVLRSGTPLFTTYTGGNKFFEQINEGGLTYISKDSPQDAARIIISTIDSGLFQKAKQCREMYEKYFTVDKYLDKYISALNEL